MADMFKPQEAAEWLHETERAYRRVGTALRHIRRAAEEQRANFEACRRDGRWPYPIREASYRDSVELLEAAVARLAPLAASEERREKREEQDAAIANLKALEEIRRRHPPRR